MDVALNSILTAYFLVITALYPLYIRDGYHGIGNTKFYFFRGVTLFSAVVILFMLTVNLLYKVFYRRDEISISDHYRNMSKTDWFVYGYAVSVMLSYLFTLYQEEAFWGMQGWYMGLCSQLMFISIYFAFSRYFKWRKELFFAIFGGSFLVFFLGILNRYSVYPIVLNGQTPGFISTLGNINWFCGYLSVIGSLGITWYWGETIKNGGIILMIKRLAMAVYVWITFLAGIVQGSNSIYLVFITIFLLLFYHSFEENGRIFRFLELMLFFTFSCQTARILRYVPGLAINYENDLCRFLTDGNLTLYIGIGILLLYIFLHVLLKGRHIQILRYRRFRYASLVIGIGFPILYAFLLTLNSCLTDGLPGLSGNPIFTFNQKWGNTRGSTWRIGFLAYLNMSARQKFIGIGPDCFTQYIYTVPDLAERAYSQFGGSRLTNAHNEWLTILVNTGALGLFCYAGIFISAFIRYLQKAEEQPIFYLCAAAVLSYSVHNMVSFQQILNTPFVFLIMGIGESIYRQEKKISFT